MRRLSSGFKDELDRAMNDPSTGDAKAPEETVAASGPRPRRTSPLRAEPAAKRTPARAA